jgi:hypothetical protein
VLVVGVFVRFRAPLHLPHQLTLGRSVFAQFGRNDQLDPAAWPAAL